jgi:hypothetical protein
MDLIFAMFGGSLCLVETGQFTIVALIQAPMLGHRHPYAVHLRQGDPERTDGTGLNAGERGAEIGVAGFQHFTGLFGFGFALLGQVGIPPAGEPVLEVPFGLAVADKR